MQAVYFRMIQKGGTPAAAQQPAGYSRMTDYIRSIEEKFPVRRTPEQKKAFAASAVSTARRLGWAAMISEPVNGESARNIIIGSPSDAQILITAHYDTPAWKLFPTVHMPMNPLLSLLYIVLQVLVLLSVSAAAASGLSLVLGLNVSGSLLAFLLVYLLLMLLTSRLFPSGHSTNSSTSGISAVLSLAEQLPAEYRSTAAMILFDQGTEGCKGSKAWAARHPDLAWKKLVIDLNAVGIGKEFVCGYSANARMLPALETLIASLSGADGYQVHMRCGDRIRPDRKQLPCHMTITACKRARLLGLYTPWLDCGMDTQADPANIHWLTERLQACCVSLSKNAAKETDEPI